jgi:hypothetical protein
MYGVQKVLVSTPWAIPNFTAWIQNWLNILLFFSPIYTKYPIVKTCFNFLFIENEIQKYLIDKSIHTPESIEVSTTFGSDYCCESFSENL